MPISLTNKVDQIYEKHTMMSDSQILFAPIYSFTTYLIDSNGRVNHTWPSNYYPGLAVWWLDNGTILRTIRIDGGPGWGGAGGGVQKIEWDGTVVWDFRYNTHGVFSHHDVKSLPNGNVLLIAWETKTYDEAIAAGRNPSYVSSGGLMPDHIIEVEPTGPSNGTIVWEWHVWDHLIQDYNSTKQNYGVVRDHPELIDINFGSDLIRADWLHINSVDYNAEFDQILLSVRNFGEIWVIDHSTTVYEAAGHTGGNSGKGGDILYRWGNPQAYQRGTASEEKFFSQHDANWIKPGYPGDGNILVFNNGNNRPEGSYSSVDEIVPPVNSSGGYYLAPGSPYGPATQTWIYMADPPTSLYAGAISGAQRLRDGNTLICNGIKGEIFEVTPEGATVWQYKNLYPSPLGNQLFKLVNIPIEEQEPPGGNYTPDLDCSGSLSWTDVEPGATVFGSFQVQNIGDEGSLLNWTVNTSSITWGTWSFTPESDKNLTPEDGQVAIQVSVVAPNQENTEFEGYIRVENRGNSSDFDVIPVYLKTPLSTYAIQTLSHQFLFNYLTNQ